MADNPYDRIGSVVEQWCKEHVYAQMLVTISIGYEWELPHEETHLLNFDAEKVELFWDLDWWEGQQHVELVGFIPLFKVRVKGEGEYVQPVRHGRWKNIIQGIIPSGQCSNCGAWDKVTRFCPNCGADMREGGAE